MRIRCGIHAYRCLQTVAMCMLILLQLSACSQDDIDTSEGITSSQDKQSSGTMLLEDDNLDIKSMDVYKDHHRIHLLVAAKRMPDAPIEMLYSNSDDGRIWSTPVHLNSDADIPPPHAPGRGKDVKIAAYGDKIIAVWTQQGDGWGGSGPMVTVQSTDGGKTWQQGPNPADDSSTKGHAYTAIIADAQGLFHLVWLDDRRGQQGLQYAYSGDSGLSWSANETIDGMTCECCWNTLAVSQQGTLHALYRGSQPRDMLLASKMSSGDWQGRKSVGAFNWNIDACPHNGGGMAETLIHDTATLHAVVWTGKQGETGVYHSQSQDDGDHWEKVRQLGNDLAKHPDIATSKDGDIGVVWDQGELDGKGTQVMLSISKDEGTSWSEPEILTQPDALASHPKIINLDNQFSIFWTEAGQDNQQKLMTFVSLL